MHIKIIPNDYYDANELTATIKRVIMQHPLNDSVTSAVREQLFKIPICVKVSDFLVDICLGVRLRFDPAMYPDRRERDKVLCHEFAHIIDRLNPEFGIDCQSEVGARNIQPKEMTEGGFMLYQSVWNCYIDGRLKPFGQNPRTLQQRLQEFHDKAKLFGHFTSEADKILARAWDSRNLTFSEIVDMVQECLGYWRPNEIKEK